MSDHQSFVATVTLDSKDLKGPVDKFSQLSVERRTLLLGAAAVAAGALSTPASASPQAPDLSAALAKFRATIPSHFNRDYVDNAGASCQNLAENIAASALAVAGKDFYPNRTPRPYGSDIAGTQADDRSANGLRR